jgi:ACS family hexuronate transporter-like MFS transporter
MGWEWAFIITGAIGFFWLIFWFMYYEIPARQKRVTQRELDYIQKDDVKEPEGASEKVSWFNLLTYRQTWAFIVGKFLTDPVWWFYLFWLPSFLNKEYGMSKTELIIPIAAVYTMTTFGSILGGWLSGYFINLGWPVYRARKTAMFIYALLVIPVVAAQALGAISPWFAVIIIGIAASAHQAWSANIFTLVSDMFPKKAIASVVGLGGMAGSVGGILIARSAGVLLDYYKGLGTIETGYYVMFFICGSAYLVAWGLMHLLTPRMQPVNI